ncbi:contact-dependent growth inhibition system immunity protein [Streptomyces sp. NPDC002888]|uniref:contact-dependent growth inhibition system immunity protein n=1 Tax=Streptomyces sp. NPDC002888 TaxID=3364668 RepID=UPI0036C7D284
MSQPIDRAKSIEQLDGQRWPAPPADATSMVRNVHDLRRRPIGTLEPHELARLIGQEVGLPWLLPLGVEKLRADVLDQAAGGFYDGDLLYVLVRRDPEVWRDCPDLARELKAIVGALPYVSSYVKSDIESFLSYLRDET